MFIRKSLAALTPWISVAALATLLFLVGRPASAAPGLDTVAPIGAFLDGAFPESTPSAEVADTEWTQVDYFPLNWVEPIRILEHPVQDRLIIVGKDGIGWSISHEEGATDRTEFFNIQPIMHGKSGVGEGGISDVAFHPEFGQSGSPNASYLYITYRWSPTRSGNFDQSPTVDGYDRLSRFSVVNGQVDLSTELVMMSQYDRQQWHVGGDMFFGPEGFLYITRGDEGNCCDRNFSTQRLDGGLWSGVLRIDVDQDPTRSHPIRRQPTHLEEDPSVNGPEWPDSFTQGYFIPNDNPFQDPNGGVLEEFYSLGLRHPFTIALDEPTGNIWVADVGQSTQEEVSIVESGDNHEWGYREGNVAGVIPEPANVIGNPTPPVFAYGRGEGQAVIGAGVYRGQTYPELFGKYIFSDFISGNLWTATPNGDVEQIGNVTAGFPNGINGYLLDSQGDILMARTSGGLDGNARIQQLVRGGDAATSGQPPQLLSQTGAFTDLQSLDVNSGCLPYVLNEPFWSDAAIKTRWMCIPNDGNPNSAAEQIDFTLEGDWEFPTGAVLIKHFELGVDESNPNATTRLETRFIVKTDDGHYGVTYRWNAAGTDAVLLAGSEERVVEIETPQGIREQIWEFPSPAGCAECHSSAAGAALGTSTRQLNRDFTYPSTGQTGNQIETLNALGLLSTNLGTGQLLDALDGATTLTPSDDTSASLEERALSYLDANCSACHRPGGVRGEFDARSTTPLNQQNLINGSLAESLGIAGEAVIVPGRPDLSIAHVRANSVNQSFSMPPLAKNLIDVEGTALLAAWIESLDSPDPPDDAPAPPEPVDEFELGNDTSTGGAFIDSHHPSLYINETDSFTQGQSGSVFVNGFSFFAQRLGNPVTPVVVEVNGNNDFTVLAIGTTRQQSEYSVGENNFPFDDGGGVELNLAAGETIAIGFMDSFADGTGWGAGTVIPAEASGQGQGQDEIWGLLPSPLILQSSGFDASRDTSAVVVGESPLATNAGDSLAQFNLQRSYKVAVTFGSDADGPVAPGPAPAPPPAPEPGPGGNLLVNGGFESVVVINDSFALVNSIAGWSFANGSGEFWDDGFFGVSASEGARFTELDVTAGAVDGIIQNVATVSGQQYTLSFDVRQRSGTQAASNAVELRLNGAVVETVVPGSTDWQTVTVSFVGVGGSTEVGLFETAAANDSLGSHLDNVILTANS